MLPSAERLTRASVFQRAYQRRMSFGSPLLTLYVLPKEGKRNDRRSGSPGAVSDSATAWKPLVGFVVSTKVSKSACKRNRGRRRMREAYRALRNEYLLGKEDRLALGQWYALVFVGHEPLMTASFAEVKKSVLDSLLRAGRRFGKAKVSNAPAKIGTAPKLKTGVETNHDNHVKSWAKLPTERDNN